MNDGEEKEETRRGKRVEEGEGNQEVKRSVLFDQKQVEASPNGFWPRFNLGCWTEVATNQRSHN
jgi:hypothetical protein